MSMLEKINHKYLLSFLFIISIIFFIIGVVFLNQKYSLQTIRGIGAPLFLASIPIFFLSFFLSFFRKEVFFTWIRQSQLLL